MDETNKCVSISLLGAICLGIVIAFGGHACNEQENSFQLKRIEACKGDTACLLAQKAK